MKGFKRHITLLAMLLGSMMSEAWAYKVTYNMLVWSVESPGILPGLVRPYNIREMHFSRNPKIALYMRSYKLVKEFGEGVDRMYREMEEAGNPAPEFKQNEFMVYATIRQHKSTPAEVVNGKTNEEGTSRGQVGTKLSLSSHQVVTKLSLSIPIIGELLQKMTEPMSAKEMRDFCGMKDATYFKANVIDALMEAGLVKMTQPDSPKSPTQKYVLTEQGENTIQG